MQLAVRLVPLDADDPDGAGGEAVLQGAHLGAGGPGANSAVPVLGEGDLDALGSVMGWLLQLAVRPSLDAQLQSSTASGTGGTKALLGLRLGAVTLSQLPPPSGLNANDTGNNVSGTNTSLTAAAAFLCAATISTTAGATDGSSALWPSGASSSPPPGLPPPLGPYRLTTATVGMRLLGLQDALLQLSNPPNTPPPKPLLPPSSSAPSLAIPSPVPGVLVGAGRDGEAVQAALQIGQQQPEALGVGEQEGMEGGVEGEVGSSSGGNTTGAGHHHHHHRRRRRSLSLLGVEEGSGGGPVGFLPEASGIDLELSLAARRQLQELQGDEGQGVETGGDSEAHGNTSALTGTPLSLTPGRPALSAAVPGGAFAEKGLAATGPAPAPAIAAGPRVVRMTDRQLVAAALSASPDVRRAVVLTLPTPSTNASNSSSSSGAAPAATGQQAQRFRLVVELYGMDRYGTCGNGLCEVGEQPTAYSSGATQGQGSPSYYTPCPADCPLPPLLTCPVGTANPASSSGRGASGAAGSGDPEGRRQLLVPCSGRGTCLPSSGACECFEG